VNEAVRRIYELHVKLASDSLNALRQIQAHAGGVEKALKGAKDMAAEFGKGLLAGVTVAAFVQQITGAINKIDELAKQAERLSMPVGEFSALAHAANMADVEMGEFTIGIKELQKSISEFQDKGSKARSIFEALGIDPTGKSTTQVLEDVAKAMQGIQDPALRSRTMLELFGKSGLAMVPLLNKGAEGIRELTEEAKRLGVVLDEEATGRQQRFEEALKRMQAASDALKRNFVEGLLPSLAQIIEAFNKVPSSAERWKAAGEVIGNVLKGIAVLAFGVVEAIGGIGNAIGAFLAAQQAVLRLDFAGAIEIIKSASLDMGEAVNRVKVFTGELFNSVPAVNEATAAAERNAEAEKKLAAAYANTTKDLKARKKAQDELNASWVKSIEQQIALRREEGLALNDGKSQLQTMEEQAELQKKINEGWVLMIEQQIQFQREQALAESQTVKNLTDVEALLKEIADKVDGYAQRVSGIFVDWATGAADAKASFADMAADIARQLAQMALQMLVFDKLVKQIAVSLQGIGGGVGDWFGGGAGAAPSAQGNVFDQGNVVPFARGGIVRKPTVFPMARGWGVMGEAGPEAVMPLGRTSSGELGVKGGGVTVNIINNTSAKVTAKEERNAAGGQTINVMVENAIENGFASGRFDKVMQGTYGLARTGRT
jgi:hypothetical protein